MPNLTPEKLILLSRRESGLTQTEFGAKIGTSKRTVIRIEKGELSPDLDLLKKIAAVLKKPVSYFIDNEKAEKSDAVTILPLQPEIQSGHIKGTYGYNSEMGYIPVEARVCANGLEMLKQPAKNEDWVHVPPAMIPYKDTLEYFGVKVDGDCMEPLIPNGSYAVAKRLHHGALPKDGAIVVISVSKTRKSLKQITYVTGTDKKRLFLLKTINDKYKEDIPIYSDILKHQILGEVEILNINTADDEGNIVESTFRRI